MSVGQTALRWEDLMEADAGGPSGSGLKHEKILQDLEDPFEGGGWGPHRPVAPLKKKKIHADKCARYTRCRIRNCLTLNDSALMFL